MCWLASAPGLGSLLPLQIPQEILGMRRLLCWYVFRQVDKACPCIIFELDVHVASSMGQWEMSVLVGHHTCYIQSVVYGSLAIMNSSRDLWRESVATVSLVPCCLSLRMNSPYVQIICTYAEEMPWPVC